MYKYDCTFLASKCIILIFNILLRFHNHVRNNREGYESLHDISRVSGLVNIPRPEGLALEEWIVRDIARLRILGILVITGRKLQVYLVPVDYQ